MGQRRTGELAEWNDERGFGFIAVDGEAHRLFVHVKAIRPYLTRPQAGDRLSFETGIGREGRPAAVDVAIAGAKPRAAEPFEHRQRSGPETSRPLGALLLLVLLAAAIVLNRAPPEFALIYLIMDGASAWSYAADKRIAANGDGRRTSERLLHGLDLFGGIIGGLLAQHIFRHKTVKSSFAVTTWLIAALHALLLAATIGGLTQGFVAEQLQALGVSPLTQGELR